jgi:hypothetical protein
MDVLAILLYAINSLRQDRIPFISDIIAFTGNSDVISGGGYSFIVTFFIFDLLLLLSLFASAWMFFKRKMLRLSLPLFRKSFVSFHSDVRFLFSHF